MRNNIFSSSFILLSVFIASGIFYSCNDRLPEKWAAPIIPSEGMVLKTFRVEISPMTKTIMNNDGEIKWLAGDQVSVFDDKKGGIGNPVYVSNSTITAEVEASASHYYSVSPYSNAVVYDALSKEIKTVLPLSQYPAPGNMDKDANLLFAVSTSGDDKMVYSNMCAIVRFSIADEDIAALKFEGLNGEKLAGGVTIKKEKEVYGLYADDMQASKAVRIVSNSDSYTFVKDTAYYFCIVPQNLEGGFKATLTKKDGSVGIYKSNRAIVAERNKVINLGTIKCAEYKSDLKADYENKGKILIGGVEYHIEDMPAFEVTEPALRNTINGKNKKGIYFLQSDVEYDISAVNISDNVVIVGNDASKSSKIVFAEDNPVLLGAGGLVLSNVVLDNAGRSGYIFGPDKAAGAVTADFDRFVIEKSEILNIHRPILYYDMASYGIKEISCKRSKLQINLSDKPDIQLFNVWKSNPASYRKFDFSDNIYYAGNLTDVQVFNGVDKVKKPYTELEITFDNNIVYNIHSSKAMVKASLVKSLSMKGNLFYVSEKKSNDFFKLYAAHNSSVISGGALDKNDNASKKNFAYALGGFGWTGYAKTKVKFFMTVWADLGAESPFEEVDADNGVFKLKEKYHKYGPQN